MVKHSYVYVLSNQRNTVLYVGVTTNLIKRVWEHKSYLVHGFTAKYNVTKLVYYEVFENVEEAIKREKQIKGSSRSNKIKLIEAGNTEWNDLSESLL